MIVEATAKLIERQDLNYEEASGCINEIMSGQTGEVQTAAFLAALATKGETVEEITGCAAAMRSHALTLDTDGESLFEIVGTGGDGAKSFNISTTSAFVLAAGEYFTSISPTTPTRGFFMSSVGIESNSAIISLHIFL